MNTKPPNPNADLAFLYERKRTLTADEAVGLDVFNQAVRGINDQRQARGDVAAEKTAQLDREWERVMAACKQLKERLASHPKIQAFNLNERSKSVQVALRTGEGKPPQIIAVARDHFHPEQNRWAPALWMFRPGNEARQYDSADLLIRDLATALASWIA